MTITQELRTEVQNKFGTIVLEREYTNKVGFVVRHTNAQQNTFTWLCILYFYYNGNLITTVESIEQIVNNTLLPTIGTVDTLVANTMEHFLDNDRIHFNLLP